MKRIKRTNAFGDEDSGSEGSAGSEDDMRRYVKRAQRRESGIERRGAGMVSGEKVKDDKDGGIASIYEYDEVYDTVKRHRGGEKGGRMMKGRSGGLSNMENLRRGKREREIEKMRRIEEKGQKEREEGGEVFVTESYKKYKEGVNEKVRKMERRDGGKSFEQRLLDEFGGAGEDDGDEAYSGVVSEVSPENSPTSHTSSVHIHLASASAHKMGSKMGPKVSSKVGPISLSGGLNVRSSSRTSSATPSANPSATTSPLKCLLISNVTQKDLQDYRKRYQERKRLENVR